MLMYPEEYPELAELIKKYVVLNILIKALDYDKNTITHSDCKFSRIYNENFVEIQWKIESDIRQTKKMVNKLGGKIIHEEQDANVRIVKAKYKGYVYTHRYLNYLLKAESEKLLAGYLKH